MSFTLPASITGGAQTGFTTPGYTTSADQPPAYNARQVVVTALTGTQAGVTLHSVSSPFLVSSWKPSKFATLGKPNPTTGLIGTVPNNQYKLLVVKGVTPAAGQPIKNCVIRITADVPAGADTYDAPNVRAALSAAIGALNAISAGLGDTLINGVM